MKKATKRFLRSMGSILDINPSSNYSEYRNLPTDTELIRNDWSSVGSYIKDSMKDNAQKKIAKHEETRPNY